MCVTIYERFCPDEGIVEVFRVDRKSSIKSHLCKSAQMAVYRNTFVIYKLRQYPHGRS